jgi:alpha-D-xyloside xylohydrolase
METRRAPNELWAYGEEVQSIAAKFARLRYRLMPYLYSLAAKVSSDGYTIMRALAFDFPTDKALYEIADQFMFGPNLLVCPVIQSGSRKRSVHLPKSCDWVDFWTGQRHLGGRSYSADAPLEIIPLLVRAGSILPLAPPAEHTGGEADPIEIRVYPGADASFTLYEDDGATFACDRGEFSTIDLRWDNQRQRLIIGARRGHFPSMLQSRTFQLVLVDQTSGLGESTSLGGIQVTYSGKEVGVNLP